MTGRSNNPVTCWTHVTPDSPAGTPISIIPHKSTKKVAFRAYLGWRKGNLWILRMTTCFHVGISVRIQEKKC